MSMRVAATAGDGMPAGGSSIGGAGSASRRNAADPTVGAPKFNVGAGN